MPHSLSCCLLLFISPSSNPSVLSNLFFHSLHRIAIRPATRPFFFSFLLCFQRLINVSAFWTVWLLFVMLTGVYSMPNDTDSDLSLTCYPLPFFSFWFSLYVVRCIRAHIYIPSSSPSSIFTLCFLYSLITNFRSFVLFFSFLLVAVVPISSVYPISLL